MPRAAAIVAVLLCAATVRASRPPLRVVVRTTSAAERAFLDRLRGQTSDLDVVILEVEAAALEPSLPQRLATAERLAEAHDAKAVVWLDVSGASSGGRMLVCVAQPLRGRLLVRSLALGRTHAAGTWALETAALVVRSALKALSQGAVIGIARSEAVLDAAGSPVAAPAPASRTIAPSPAPPATLAGAPSPPAGAIVPWGLSAGWRMALDGYGRYGAQGGALEGWLGVRKVEVYLVIGGTVAERVEDEVAEIRLSRLTAAAGVAAPLHLGRGLSLRGGAHIGAAFFWRTAAPLADYVRATPSKLTPALLVGAELQLVWAPARLRGVRPFVGAGVDVVPGAPTLAYTEGEQPIGARQLWICQPVVAIGVMFRGR